MKKKDNILIIAPHCDDEILGCGATINYFQKLNFNIFVLIITNANNGNNLKYSKKYIDNLRKEALSAHKLLKVSKTFFLEFPAPCLDQVPISEIAEPSIKISDL